MEPEKCHPQAGLCEQYFNETPSVYEKKLELKWKSMKNRGLEPFILSHSQTFRRRLRRGTLQQFRWDSWNLMLRWNVTRARLIRENVKTLMNSCDLSLGGSIRGTEQRVTQLDSLTCIALPHYHTLAKKKSSFSNLIDIDIPRTLPEVGFFNVTAQTQLRRILNAYANYDPNVGYCQGMNFIAAFILLVSNFQEYEAYCFFVAFMECHEMDSFFCEKFPLLINYVEVLDMTMKEILPDLHLHFSCEGVLPAMYIYQWFLTLFVCVLPLPSVVIIWDFILAEGLFNIIHVALSLLKALRRLLLSLHFEDAVKFLKSLKSSGDCNQSRVGRLLVRQVSGLGIPDHILASIRRVTFHPSYPFSFSLSKPNPKNVMLLPLDNHSKSYTDLHAVLPKSQMTSSDQNDQDNVKDSSSSSDIKSTM